MVVNFSFIIAATAPRASYMATGARPEYEVKPLMEWAPDHALNLFQHAEGVEALGATAV